MFIIGLISFCIVLTPSILILNQLIDRGDIIVAIIFFTIYAVASFAFGIILHGHYTDKIRHIEHKYYKLQDERGMSYDKAWNELYHDYR